MQFFDLNIPYIESTKSIPNKQTRLKQIVKLMELGYSGIAYNRTIKGAMAEYDRCTISPFPLSSLLNLSPSLSSVVVFHRRVLGVPENAAFRQYTRLTVVVESNAQVSALNSGNPILKSYDFVAVRPLNQNCFDVACQSSQVDLVSIDFGEKLPFRLKLPMVKAAIARGVYFEIMYSSLLQDVQVRRQMISNAKLLVDWTRGKNLIVSSAASSVLELRGPYDVANLLSLLGLSNECAKATISKNCRLLAINALKKKQFYKEAIRVEAMPHGVHTDPNEPWMVDHVDWDPLSSGEGDLVLNDMAKAFAESGKLSQMVSDTDCCNDVDNVHSHGLQVNDIDLRSDGKLCASSNFTGVLSTSEDPKFLNNIGNNVFPSLCNSLLDKKGKAINDFQQAILPVLSTTPTNEAPRFCSVGSQLELKNLESLETITSPVKLHDLELQNNTKITNDVLFSHSMKEITPKDDGLRAGCIAGSRKKVLKENIVRLNCNGAETDDLNVASGALKSMDSGISTEMQICVEAELSQSPDVALARNLLELKADSVADEKSAVHAGNVMDFNSCIEMNSSNGLCLGDQQLPEEMDKKKEQNEDYSVVRTDINGPTIVDTMMLMDSPEQGKVSNDLSDDLRSECRKQVQKICNVEYQSPDKEKIGNLKVKRHDVNQVLKFPFKRLLQGQFKKKRRNFICKTRKRE